MPLFEFNCRDCGKRFTFLTGVIRDNTEPRCPRCGSVSLDKLISRVARGRSDDDRMDELADRMEQRNLDDPHEVQRFARDMSRELAAETGEDVADEMEEMIEAEARGEDGLSDTGGGADETIY